MPLSVVDIYKTILPKTNCKACGYPTCIAFASMVVSERLPLKNCPRLPPEVVEKHQGELSAQYAAGIWTKRDPAEDALKWARHRAASMKLEDLPQRIGGVLCQEGGSVHVKLPYFTDMIRIYTDRILTVSGDILDRWEQILIYNHLSQGGTSDPSGKWRAFQEFPNTVSKVKSMVSHVEIPLITAFHDRMDQLDAATLLTGGQIADSIHPAADHRSYLFSPLPKIPVKLLFWKGDDDFPTQVKLHFDETVADHLDIESILFLSEQLAGRLLRAAG